MININIINKYSIYYNKYQIQDAKISRIQVKKVGCEPL